MIYTRRAGTVSRETESCKFVKSHKNKHEIPPRIIFTAVMKTSSDVIKPLKANDIQLGLYGSWRVSRLSKDNAYGDEATETERQQVEEKGEAGLEENQPRTVQKISDNDEQFYYSVSPRDRGQSILLYCFSPILSVKQSSSITRATPDQICPSRRLPNYLPHMSREKLPITFTECAKQFCQRLYQLGLHVYLCLQCAAGAMHIHISNT